MVYTARALTYCEPDLLELHRRTGLLGELDVALEQLRRDGLVKGTMHVGFGQEAEDVGATAQLVKVLSPPRLIARAPNMSDSAFRLAPPSPK